VTRVIFPIVRVVAGSALVAVGVVGCLLPILPGIPFLVLGLGLLSVDIAVVRRLRERALAYLRERRAKSRKG